MTSPDAPSPSGREKSRLRSAIRTRRRARVRKDPRAAGEGRAQAAETIVGQVEGARCIGAYLAAAGEPDPLPAMAAWHRAGLTVLVPISAPGRRLDWVEWTPELPIAMGTVAPVPEPVGGTPADPTGLDLVVVPALAVGRDGTRLGQGGGFYDTFLAGLPGVTTVGCVFGDELLDSVPSEPWDARLDAVWTQSGVRALPITDAPAR